MIVPSLVTPVRKLHQHRVAAAMAVEDLLAREADLHRPARASAPRLRDDDLVVERIALAAEAAAVRRGDHADVRRRQVQHLGQRAVQVVRRLRARVDDQLAVRIARARPRRAARSAGGCCPRRRRRRRRRGRRRRAPASTSPNCSDDLLVDVALVAVVVDARLGRAQRFLGSAIGVQRLVVDVDEIERPRSPSLVARRPRPRPGRRRSAPCRGTARARPGSPAGCRRGSGSRRR